MSDKANEVTYFIDVLDMFETAGDRETDGFGLVRIQEEAWEILNDACTAEESIDNGLTSPGVPESVVPLFCPYFVEEPEELPGANERITRKVRLRYPRHPHVKAIMDSLDQENSDSYWDAFNVDALFNSSASKDDKLETKAAFVEELMTMALVEFGRDFLNEWVDEDFLELLKEAADEAIHESQ